MPAITEELFIVTVPNQHLVLSLLIILHPNAMSNLHRCILSLTCSDSDFVAAYSITVTFGLLDDINIIHNLPLRPGVCQGALSELIVSRKSGCLAPLTPLKHANRYFVLNIKTTSLNFSNYNPIRQVHLALLVRVLLHHVSPNSFQVVLLR